MTERDLEISWELQEARTMLLAGNSETAIADHLDRALELLADPDPDQPVPYSIVAIAS